jgi:UDP-3-O-[3-hydroxymyristoyl] N-acetylglucosamine deacetylase
MAARTFGFLKDYEYLLDKGFAKGSSADNTVIIGEKEIVNPSKLNHPFDFVRHKTLDLIGDLALLGRPLHANIRAHCSGHAMNYELVKKILDICK